MSAETEGQDISTDAMPAKSEALDYATVVAERDGFKSMAQRAQADLVNYRRRVITERASDRLHTTVRLGLLMMETADQLENALSEYLPAGLPTNWATGIKAIYDKLIATLNAEGFERYEAVGQVFDPLLHEALATNPSVTVTAGTITDQIRVGYRYNGETVRPAQVEIATNPTQPNPTQTKEQNTDG